jgi:(1->4)-alpha-D-glucan 1-alpha-D-glucosylmutase
VGDSPAVAGIDEQEFHRRMQTRRKTLPYSLNATSTHDTKRGEDARIRLNYLSAIPREWITAVDCWRSMNAGEIGEVNGRAAPSPNDEYLIYQALLGAWPGDGLVTDPFRERFAGYLTKALREADTETHYNDINEAYEAHCQAFASAILRDGSPFLEAFSPFARDVQRQSAVYSLSQLLLKITAPGIPDIYQGAEGWETSLVDPDNRRAVDYEARISLLAELKMVEADGRMAACIYAHNNVKRGAEKLYTLCRGLAVRNRLVSVFADGDYLPLATEGPVLAFLRHHGEDWVLVAVPLIRYAAPVASPVTISLPPEAPDRWMNAFTGETLRPSGMQEDSHPDVRTLSWPQGFRSWPVVLATAR